MEKESDLQSTHLKNAKAELEMKVIAKYPALTIEEIKTIVIEKKWIHAIAESIRSEMDSISHRLTGRIKELAERYETPLPSLSDDVKELEQKVHTHLQKMGFVWN